MPQWTLLGLLQGRQTAPWPLAEGTDGQAGFLGMPRYKPELCTEGCQACADICPTKAISMRATIDLRRHAQRRLWSLRRMPTLHRGLSDRRNEPIV